jgi:hypothetical protein
MNGKEIVEKILNTIGKDDDLLQAFALAIGESEKDLGQFIDYAEIPEIPCHVPEMMAA